MKKKDIQHFYNGTTRQWKTQKRREWKAIVRAYEVYRVGSAYTPTYPTIGLDLEKLLRDGQTALSEKKWGR